VIPADRFEVAGSFRDPTVVKVPPKLTAIAQRISAAGRPCAAGIFAQGFGLKTLLLIACIVGVSRDARAETCGHYLYRNGVPVSVTAPKVTLPLQMTPAEQTAPAPQAPPCNGPGCRRQSVPLSPPAAPGTRLLQSDPAVLLQDLLKLLQASATLPIPRSDDAAVSRSSSIFRPPMA
jgi:hypothetical protein